MNTSRIAKRLHLSENQVRHTLALFAEGATIPFIARYRQERTGGLDEVEIAAVQKENQYFIDLDKRRDAIVASIAEQGLLTDELKAKMGAAATMADLEDLYLPYKPKRKTKASVARERGLEPLAAALMKQDVGDPVSFARRFVKGEVGTTEDALEGARHIIAEWVNERQSARQTVRRLFSRKGMVTARLVKGMEEAGMKYRGYFDFAEALARIPSHRLLAIRRAEAEGVLRVGIAPPEEEAIEAMERIFVKGRNAASAQVAAAVKDAYKRLLKPSLETEFQNESKARADEQAIAVFAENLRQLLLAPPLGQKRTLAIDPGFKSGCKVVCLDAQGQLLHNENIYPHPPQNQRNQAAAKISQLAEAYKIEAVAIGNGTAGRETEDFVRSKVFFKKPVEVFVVNEAGASVYSASAAARAEFANYDVTVRGAVSIGRRLMDPLAELVKIDPQSIGVGQYQHDVDQGKLKEALDRTVISVVNNVGVELNTAGSHLLHYVSGLGPKLAAQVVEHRNQNGPFKSREELRAVKGLGPKAFEQAAGFLRIAGADNPLDNSAVHPESYAVAQAMARDLKVSVAELVGNLKLLSAIVPQTYATEGVGLPTVKNVVDALGKAGRDPRGRAEVFSFDPNLRKIDDLREGMIVPGIVTNITNFGAFTDVGVKQDGLIHVSEMADRYISDPNEIVKLGQQVRVKVVSVDVARKRIQLSLKQA